MSLENFRKIKIDLNHADEPIIQKLFAKEGDSNGRQLEVQLTDLNIIEDQSNLQLILHWTHLGLGNRGNLSFKPVNAAAGIFKVTYPDEMLNAGNVQAWIQIIDTIGGPIISTPNFTIVVEGSGSYAQAVVASDDFKVLNDTLRKVHEMEGAGGTAYVNVPVNSVGQNELKNWSISRRQLTENYSTVDLIRDGDDINDLVAHGMYFKENSPVAKNIPDELSDSQPQLLLWVDRYSASVTVQTLISFYEPDVEYVRSIGTRGPEPWKKKNRYYKDKPHIDTILEGNLKNVERYVAGNIDQTNYDLGEKLTAIQDIEIVGIDSDVPVKIWMLSRNYMHGTDEDTPWNYRIQLGKKENDEWSTLIDTGANFTVNESSKGATAIEFSNNEVAVKMRIDYNKIPNGGRILDGNYMEAEPNYIISPRNVKLSEGFSPEEFEVYNQSLNKTDNVQFASVETDLLEVGGQLPAGTLNNPPRNIMSGDVWADTTDSNIYPVIRVML